MDKIAEALVDNKTRYGDKCDNFVIDGEITVTITLNEYRELVKCKATTDYQVSKAEEDRYTRLSENEALKKENACLKAELYELKKDLDETAFLLERRAKEDSAFEGVPEREAGNEADE